MASTNVGSIHYELGLNTGKFDAASNSLGKKLDGIGKKMQDTGKKMTMFVTVPVVLGFVGMVKAASDLDETMNKMEVSFKDQSEVVKKWSKTSIDSMGLAQQSALDAAALFGDMSTAMGLSTVEAADMSTSLVSLGADMASFKNVSFERAQTALAGVFTGETEALKGLGVIMTETNLLAFAQAQGIEKTVKEMSQAEKVQLRYEYLMSVTTNAQGDFMRTADGTANRTRKMMEQFKELSAELGTILLPIADRVLAFASNMIAKFSALSREQQTQILMWAGVAAAVGPSIIILGAVARGASALIVVLGALARGIVAVRIAVIAMSAALTITPFGLVLTAATLLGAAIFGIATSSNRADNAINRLTDAQNSLKDSTNNLKNAQHALSGAQLQVEGASLRAEQAQINYNQAVKDFGKDSLQARMALHDLKVSNQALADATKSVKDRTKEALDEQNKIVKAKQAIINANNEIAASAANMSGQLKNVAANANAARNEITRAQAAGESVPATTQLQAAGLPSMNIPRRASGGPVSAGQPYWVGDNANGSLNKTSELFVPKESGTIMNQDQLNRGGSDFKMYGNINIGNKSDADYFFERLNRNQSLSLMGVAERGMA